LSIASGATYPPLAGVAKPGVDPNQTHLLSLCVYLFPN
jgi:hypothetical protein